MSMQDFAALIAICTAAWGAGTVLVGVFRYMKIKSEESRQKKFKIYHKLIRELVEPGDQNRSMMLDRQVAIVFELRNFKNYFPVSIRILQGLRRTWSNPAYERLIEEIDLSIAYGEKKMLWVAEFLGGKEKPPGEHPGEFERSHSLIDLASIATRQSTIAIIYIPSATFAFIRTIYFLPATRASFFSNAIITVIEARIRAFKHSPSLASFTVVWVFLFVFS
jgi:hypothetical protein